MNISTFLFCNTALLKEHGIESARLDCLLLLEDVFQKDRAWLLAHDDTELNNSQNAILNTFITQRINHIPLAYIRGKVSFYGRDFSVNKHVLVPRPETEQCIIFLKSIADKVAIIADIGTGSGCLAVTAVLELPHAQVYAYDIDHKALLVAQANATRHQVDIHFQHADLMQNFAQYQQDGCDVILANLPYVPTAHPVNRAAQHEPSQAIFSGNDGLEHYRIFWQQIRDLQQLERLTIPHIIVESLPFQKSALQQLAQTANYALVQESDYVQHFHYST